MDCPIKKEIKSRRLLELMWRMFILEWTLSVMLCSYLVVISHLSEELQSKILACSDIHDYAKIPKQYQYLCGKRRP